MFITGATGLLGRHVQRSPAAAEWEMVAPGSRSLDIRRREAVIEMIRDWKPTAVVHLAYRKDDRRGIVDGSRNVAEGAAACGARLVHLSTDVVFAGRPAPYVESDPTFAVTDYGVMKADAEREVMQHCPGAVMVRTSLMYATDFLAPLQIDVERALRGQNPMTFFSDEFRCPSHAADIAAAVAALASMPAVTGPLHVAGPRAMSRADLARSMARWLGGNPALLRTGTIAEQGISRPARIVLDSAKAAALGLQVRPIEEALR